MLVTKSNYALRILFFLFALFLSTLFLLTGCSKRESGKSNQTSTAAEETLLFTTKETGSASTKTATVSYGDFSGDLQLEGNTLLPVETNIICDVEYGTMIYDECYVKPWDLVEAGQVLANVHMDIDPILIQDKKYELERKEERFLYADKELQEEMDTFAEDMYSEKDELRRKKMEVQYEDFQAKKAYAKTMYELSCKELAEEIAEMEEATTITSITAPEAGVILTVSDIDTQTALTKGQTILTMAPISDLYITADNSTGHFLTGMSVNIKASTETGSDETIGTVVSASSKGISSDFSSDLAYIRLDEPNMEIYSSSNITIYASIRNLNHMLLVDSNAVTLENGFGYVTVVNDDGTLTKTKFEFSLSNSDYYIVSKGLAEGTTVVLN